MNSNKFLPISQLSKLYNLSDITLYRDFKKLLHQNIGEENVDYFKYRKDSQLHKFEWRINPIWFENNVNRKVILDENEKLFQDEDLEFRRRSTYDKEWTDEPITSNNNEGGPSDTEDTENMKGIRMWLMEKIDELTEMLKNSQILILKKDKQIESLQKKVLMLEEPASSIIDDDFISSKTKQKIHDYHTVSARDDDESEFVHDEVNSDVPDRELHTGITPYETSEHDEHELLTSIRTLENVITDRGTIDTTEVRQNIDSDDDPWEDEGGDKIPKNPNIRVEETDPRVLDSDLEPVNRSYTDEDTFTRIARDRGY